MSETTPLNKFTSSFGAVCRTDVQMTWISHAHRKPNSDKRMDCLNFLDLGVLTCSGSSKGGWAGLDPPRFLASPLLGPPVLCLISSSSSFAWHV